MFGISGWELILVAVVLGVPVAIIAAVFMIVRRSERRASGGQAPGGGAPEALCGACRTPLAPSDKFCRNCGARV